MSILEGSIDQFGTCCIEYIVTSIAHFPSGRSSSVRLVPFFKDLVLTCFQLQFLRVARMHSEPCLRRLPESTHVAPIPDSRLQL